jgi:hypothetical protein
VKGIHPFPKSDAEERENWRVFSDISDELYFKPTFYAGDGACSQGAAFVSNVLPGDSTVEFPAAAGLIPTWRTECRRRARWRNARVRITITYSAIVGGVNPFVLGLRTREHQAGDVLATANILAVRLVIPGPAVAQTEMEAVYVSPAVAINGAKPNLTFAFFRDKTDAADTNANSLHVLSVEWEVIPL